MKTLMVYSESGGVGKTTTAVSLAQAAAASGLQVVLIDLDPRAAATRWVDVEPTGEGLHVGAILAAEDPTGWAEDLAVPSGWHDNLRVVPSGRSVSNREADRDDHAYLRLKRSLMGLQADLVVLDCPNRQGGPLVQAALAAANAVVYAATPSRDGVDGFLGAQNTVHRYMQSRELLNAPVDIEELGVVVTGYQAPITPRVQTASVDLLRESGMMLTPLVPHRTIVQECRMAGAWYGDYSKADPVVAAYGELTEKIMKEMP